MGSGDPGRALESAGHRRERGLRRTAAFQGGYYAVTGVWALVSRPTFEATTGPKVDYWLARTVGALSSVIGVTLGVAAWRRQVTAELVLLGAGSAVGFATIDVVYAATGRISRVYLIDAVAEGAIVAAWARALRRQ